MGLGSLVTQPPSHRSEDGSIRGKSFLRKGLAALTVAGLTIGGSLMGASAAQAADLDIPDAGLRAALNFFVDENRAPDSPLTVEEVQDKINANAFKTLGLKERFDVGSLDGLESLEAARDILVFGSFNDIAPLTELPNLRMISLASDNLGPVLPETSVPLTYLSLAGAQFTSLEGILEIGLGENVTALHLNGTRIPNIAALQDVQFSSNPTVNLGSVASTSTVTVGPRSEISDLGPLAGVNNLRLGVRSASVSDLTPIANSPFKSLHLNNNFISDISMLGDQIPEWSITSQSLTVGPAAVNEVVQNPTKGRDGTPATVTSTSDGFVASDDGNWLFTTPGEKSINFEWIDPTYTGTGLYGGHFTGTISMTVTEGVIGGGDAQISGTPAIGQELTADSSGWEPEDVELSYQWFVDGEPIDGATDETFFLTGDLAGKNVTVAVTGSKDGYGPETVESAPVTIATPAIDVAPSAVKPGEEVTVTGENFAPGEEVTIELQPDGTTVTVTTDENGAFIATVTVPEDAEAGDYTVDATGAESGVTASENLVVEVDANDDGNNGNNGNDDGNNGNNGADNKGDETDKNSGSKAPGKVTPSKDAGTESATLAQTGAPASPAFLISAAALALLGAGLMGARAIARKRA